MNPIDPPRPPTDAEAEGDAARAIHGRGEGDAPRPLPGAGSTNVPRPVGMKRMRELRALIEDGSYPAVEDVLGGLERIFEPLPGGSDPV